MPEKRALCLGYLPLTDSLPLLAADAWGLFAEEGLQVRLQQETSWAALRDRLTVGQLDAAPLLAPMVLSTTLGLAGLRVPLLTAYGMGRNGNAITVSCRLFSALLDSAEEDSAIGCARALAAVVSERRRRRQAPLVLAVVFPYSSHTYLLRYWLASAGIDPDLDVTLVVLPPSQMADHLQLGHIDGFCAGEPWNSWAVERGAGQVLLSGHQIWQHAPEKVLAVTASWAMQHPGSHAALLRALFRAGERLGTEPMAALDLLAEHLLLPASCLRRPFAGEVRGGLCQQPLPAEHFHHFQGQAATFPWRSQAHWFLSQMRSWQQLPVHAAVARVDGCWRGDWYRAFLHELTDAPLEDLKVEGACATAGTVAGRDGRLSVLSDRFCDGAVFPLV